MTPDFTAKAITTPVNLADPAFLADPHVHYAWLRDNDPVHHGVFGHAAIGEQPAWLISRYDECRDVLSDERFARSPGGQGPAIAAGMPEHLRLLSSATMIMKDDPEHRRLRTLVTQPFTPRAIARLGDRVAVLAEKLLDELVTEDMFELRKQFALPIPATVISEMVGVADTERAQFRTAVQSLISGTTDVRQGWDEAVRGLIELVRTIIDRKRATPGEDILTGLIEAEEQGDRLADDELVAMVLTLIAAGFETTYTLITNSVVTLLDHPDQLARLRAASDDEAFWRSAVDELIRYTGSIGGTKPLTTATEVNWYGQTLPAGATVFPLLASANRAPRAFEAPDQLDLGRHPNHHLGFGHGIHFCLGASLARLETRIALEVLLRRCPGLALATDRDALEMEPVPLMTRYRAVAVSPGPHSS
ncbi:hypothetical protein AD006_30425 (plasmid) [Pseudonocardia sp. EC080610-09]|nr:hypothetical protein AD006_30425 [Pseudonocardia sp. EC080610-09]ALL85771.1 hypothetical protein AD017_30825 [Pseudonocardia sp. EC080619-01]